MSSLDKLLKYVSMSNIAEALDDEKLSQIADDVIKGYEIDEDSRKDWLEINKQAMDIIKNKDDSTNRIKLYEGQCKLLFPLLAPATIQLASRLITHIVRNDKTVEFKVLGKDTKVPENEQEAAQYEQMIQQNPQAAQQIPAPKMIWEKQSKADKVSELMNYELLVESKAWLKDTHKICHIVASWGTAFKRVYFDYVKGTYCSEKINPEDVVVNQNVTSLEDAPRITVKHRFTKREIIEQQRNGYFLGDDLDLLETDPDDDNINNFEEISPVYLFLCQTCYIDLDEDGYDEPYTVYVNKASRKVYSIIPAFEVKDIDADPKGKIKSVKRRLDIVDFHAIDDPEGGFYSIGLNYLLLHPNKALTSIQRALVDAGMLSNAAAVSGFVTKAFKTKERSIRVKLGEFPVLDCNPNVDPNKQIIPMPFREPSQVLLNMFQILIDISKNNGFLNDILTGDVEMQNVPATTTLAMTEQATRAFKPMIQKLYMSLKDEFKILFHLHSKHLTEARSINLQNSSFTVSHSDFDEEALDIVPVADPTQSSEALKYARLRLLQEGMQVFGPVTNLKEAATLYYTDAGFPSPETLVQEQQSAPDPKLIEIQMKAQIADKQHQLDMMSLQLQSQKQQFDQYKNQAQFEVKSGLAHVKAIESGAKVKKLEGDAASDYGHMSIEQQQIDINKAKLEIDNKKADAALISAKKPTGTPNGE